MSATLQAEEARLAASPGIAPETETMRVACQRLGISYAHGCALAAQGRFPVRVIRAGKRVIVPRADLDRLLGLVVEVRP